MEVTRVKREITALGKALAYCGATLPGFFMIWLAPGPVWFWMIIATVLVLPLYRFWRFFILEWPFVRKPHGNV